MWQGMQESLRKAPYDGGHRVQSGDMKQRRMPVFLQQVQTGLACGQSEPIAFSCNRIRLSFVFGKMAGRTLSSETYGEMLRALFIRKLIRGAGCSRMGPL